MNNSVIIGTLLGDAWIQKHKNKPHSYSFKFEQANKQYTIWKSDMIGLPYTISERNRHDTRTNKDYYICGSYVKMNKESKEQLYNLFYNPKKRVTVDILSRVDSLALCIWFLDDGNTYYNGNNCHITLSVNGFTENDKDLIIHWFREKHNLNFRKSSNAIRIVSRRECEAFMLIVEELIPECMNYKKLSVAIDRYKEKRYGEKV